MNKSVFTYRFDQNGNRYIVENKETNSDHQNQQIIPLFESKKVEPFKVAVLAMSQQKQLAEQVQTMNPFTTDYGAWISPFDAETNRIERLIKEAQIPVEEYSVEPVTPYINTRNSIEWHEQPAVYSRSSRRALTPWIRIFTSAAGAIVTGALFGFLVLSMFSNQKPSETVKTNNVSVTKPSSNVDKTPAADTTSVTNIADSTATPNSNGQAAAPETKGIIQVNIPAQTYYMLQYGVFNNQKGALTAQGEMDKAGYAGVLEQTDKFYIYSGVAVDHNNAIQLREKLQNNKKATYLKAFELPEVQNMKWSGTKADSLQAYFASSSKLITLLSGASLSSLLGPSVLNEGSITTIKNEHKTWTGLYANVNQGFLDDNAALMLKMSNAMNSAIVSLDQYKKNSSSSYLWQIQAAIIQYLISERELIAAASVQ